MTAADMVSSSVDESVNRVPAAPPDKSSSHHDLEKSNVQETFVSDEHDELSTSHREYLVTRHGTDQLDPLPSPDDADPYNWPAWKKTTNLVLVALHAMMSTFNAASIIPAFVVIAKEFHISVPQASYLASLQIAILGGAPLFWRPLSNRFGRRPIFLLSLLAACICNIGCAESYSYGSMATCRALVAFFISPAMAIGSAVVTETFFKHERARYIGVWTLLVTLGVPVSPFIFGFVIQRVGYRWVYWVLAITHGAQFILYILFGAETLFIRNGSQKKTGTIKSGYFSFGRIDPTPFRWIELVAPLRFFFHVRVLVPTIAYSMVFLIGSVITTIEIPQLFGEKFEFGPQALGLQFIGIIIGSVIGEQVGGVLSDRWMSSKTKRLGGQRPAPEYRLWLSYPGTLLVITGIVVFLVQIERIVEFNVTPDVGTALAAAGNQIVTTVLITYAVDCYVEDAAGVGVFITFVRQIWGFIGPFWFPAMFESAGLEGSAGICVGLVVLCSLLPVIFLQFFGHKFGK